MTLTVDEIIDDTLRHEGGYVNDPDDPGGATNFGITIHTMRRLRVDVDGDGDVDVADVKALTLAEARRIYKTHYFERPRIAQLPEPLHATVFDMYVNAGGNAIKLLQRLVTDMGFPATADGAIGPKTIAAVNAAYNSAPDHIVDAYGVARRNYYFRIADRRAASRKFARARSGGKGGWIKRAEAFMSPRWHMSDGQFRERVSAWA